MSLAAVSVSNMSLSAACDRHSVNASYERSDSSAEQRPKNLGPRILKSIFECIQLIEERFARVEGRC